MVEPDLPKAGGVIRYRFLWPHDAEASKVRPCAVAVSLSAGRVMVLPITHSEPTPEQAATHIFIPESEKRLARLDDDPQWIVADVMNYFDWPNYEVAKTADGSAFILGEFSKEFFSQVLAVLKKVRTDGKMWHARR